MCDISICGHRFAEMLLNQVEDSLPRYTSHELIHTDYSKIHGHCEAKPNVNLSRFQRIYGIGDNPAADIRGANGAGPHWTSILVKTGVWTGSDVNQLKDTDRPAILCTDVYEAVNRILDKV